MHSAVRNLNVGQTSIVEFLTKKGYTVENSPNFVLNDEMYKAVEKEFGGEKKNIVAKPKPLVKNETVTLENKEESANTTVVKEEKPLDSSNVKVLGSIDLSQFDRKPKHKEAKKEVKSNTPKKQEHKPKANVSKPEITENKKEVINNTKKADNVKVEQPTVKEGDTEKANKTYDQRMAESKDLFRASTEGDKISAPKVLGTIDLSQFEKKKPEAQSADKKNKNKRNRIKKDNKVDINNPKNHREGGNAPKKTNNANNNGNKPEGAAASKGSNNNQSRPNKPNDNANKDRRHNNNKNNNQKSAPVVKQEISDDDIQKQIKETLARLSNKNKKSKTSAHRKDKRDAFNAKLNQEQELQEIEKKKIKVTEFVTVSDLAKMMDVSVTEVITACMNLGLMVSINQRLDAEALSIVAEEFSFEVEFVSVDIQESIASEEDNEEDMTPRPPIVTVMGHVDHGKTSLLDFIRKANVIAGEAGGITQHIGAYNVVLDGGKRITFLDTPGHEAFTAMRARGASVTDVAIIIIAADDSVMPQTIEAINHASAAGVPIVFAINKIDKPGANPDRIREQLAAMNYLVEDWGGKYQCQEIAAKSGKNVEDLLEKVILESEILNLKANAARRAEGVVIESSLDKGRGYTTTVLVQRGTLNIGDTMLSGTYTGRVKAMFNERGKRIKEAGPSSPVLVLGLNGAPQAGDKFNIMDDDKQARDIANKREQLQRIQGLRTQKHITLDDIGHRIAIGNFQELNIIVKGDFDGSVEALTDSLLKESQEQVQVKVIHKAVGQISESDVLLAAASNALIIGFQVRPSANARKVAEKEEIEIRLYSIIYDAIEDIKNAIKGMLAPKFKEKITCSVEVLETFKISKVGTIAGCIVREGKITRNTNIRIIRDGVVAYTGKLGSLKRFKDDAKEVGNGLECGLNIENFNDIKIGDIVEGYEQVEVAQ